MHATMDTIKKFDTLSLIILVALLGTDAIFWFNIVAGSALRPGDYFLDVGQGDSELVVFPNNVRVMTDAGPDNTIVDTLGKLLTEGSHYIDLAIISHPQLDHFNGYNYLMDNGYQFGAFIYNGRDDDPPIKAWTGLLAKIKSARIPFITLAGGDRMRAGDSGKLDANQTVPDAGEIYFLTPSADFLQSAELNDTAFAELVSAGGMRTLLTSDADMDVEDFLLKTGADVRADILKVGHHGSNYSSSDAFLRAVNPKAAVIEVGAHNAYGHPGKAALARIASSTHAMLFRTDRDGTVKIFPGDDGKMVIKKEK